MPGVGKSTIGVILAKEIGFSFLDSDLLIQDKYKKKLSAIIAERGIDGFLKAEEEVNASIEARRTVIATGGSVVYSEKAMAHLKEIGTVIYIKSSVETLSRRLNNLKGRGVVLREGQTLQSLFEERMPLYEKYADIIVDEDNCDIEETLDKIINAYSPILFGDL
ncbi:MAG: shikimate kinase [Lachnospiraceae bacterium]|nr:shikimate kinase [Lachnospiraceae bacterium]MCR5388722.1 shikimate kinase [Lachnospiraceae bacterium]